MLVMLLCHLGYGSCDEIWHKLEQKSKTNFRAALLSNTVKKHL